MPERRVVITAAGIVCAAGHNTDEFFDALIAGKTGIGPFRRFDAGGLTVRQGGEVPLGCLASPPPLPGRRTWDPIVDTKAVLAWNALLQIIGDIPENAGFCTTMGLERIDMDAIIHPDPGKRPVCPEYPLTLFPGAVWRSIGRAGPVSIQASACAAGSISIGTAFRDIRSGRADAVVAGGTDSLLFPYGVHAFASLSALSERNDLGARALAPFDRDRSGTLLGEGAAFLLLEERDSALERSRPVLAEILGFGASMDAHHWVIPDPTGAGAAAAMRAALADARLEPAAIGYLNAHGTGTRHNDAMEARAILDVFGESTAGLPVSSTKPFTGHLLTAAGAVEAVASLLPFIRGFLPPNLHLSTPDPEVKLDIIGGGARAARPRAVMSNSYGLGGQNAVLILGAPDHTRKAGT
ncbi:MAG TPA: beta-ketoacyl-[acyl-carrier-protein] synthase family protein [Candidatus Ozemobacteraceae bacterium]